MCYNGWSNYVYSKYKNSELFNYSKTQERIIAETNLIEERFISTLVDSLRIIDTYDGSNWPVDNLIGIASLDNKQLKRDSINTIVKSGKHKSGLIHHSGNKKSIVRGSSSAMITFCLNESGYDEIRKYNNEYRNIFIDEFLGIELVKENEYGSNNMDVGSGPVVFGYGASATIMNIKTQASLDNANSKLTWPAMNLIAFPINIFKKKYYLLGKEPMLDLFMLWGSVELE